MWIRTGCTSVEQDATIQWNGILNALTGKRLDNGQKSLFRHVGSCKDSAPTNMVCASMERRHQRVLLTRKVSTRQHSHCPRNGLEDRSCSYSKRCLPMLTYRLTGEKLATASIKAVSPAIPLTCLTAYFSARRKILISLARFLYGTF